MPASPAPYRVSEIQAQILMRLDAGEVLHRTAHWIFVGDRKKASWSSARQLEMHDLIEACDPKAVVRVYQITELGRAALKAYRALNGTAANLPAAPHDRTILVLTSEEGTWERVRWRGNRFKVEGEDSWILPEEVEEWREASQPAIGIGAAQEA
jgi:DNA-binding PadR family transcriptional regulator